MFIVFTKGEIIMNNIYKVIWSKAKNCYVVASEIARSHTKSATGSGKIGGVTRRSLLASLMALSLLCGGLGVATASLEVVDQSGTDGTVTIYTKDEVDKALDTKGAATDVETNKAAIADLKNAVGAAGSGLTKEVADQKAAITANTKSIDTNKAAIESLRDDKLGKDLANSTFATKDALNDLTTTVNNKVDESVVEAALQGKADKATTLAGYGINDAYTKDKVDENLDLKANAADVYTKTDADGKFATSDALTTAKTDLEEKITTAKTELDGKIAGNTTKITANEKAIQNLNAKAGTTETTLTDLSGRMAAAESDIDGLQADMATAKSDIGTLKADVSTAKSDITSLKAKDTELSGKIDAEIKNRITSDTALDQKIDAEIKNRITSDTALDQKIDKEIQDRKDAIGTIAENKNYIEKDKSVSDNLVKLDAQATKNADAITATNKRTAGIKRNDATNETTIEGNVTVDNLGNVKAKGDVTADGKLTGKGVDAGAGDITTTGAVNAGSLKVENASQLKGDVTMDKTLSVTGDTKLKKTDVDGTLNVTGESSLKNTQVDGTLSVNKETTLNGTLTAKGEAKFEKNVTIEKDLTVNGKLNVGEIAMENKKTDADGTIHNSSTTITADGITHHGEVKKSGVTTESQFIHTEKGSETYAKKGDTTDWTETRSDVTADGVKTEAKDSKGNRTNTSQTAKDINGNVTDKDGNKTDMKVTATENSIQIQDKDGKNTNLQVNTKDSSVTEITNAAGATTKTEQTAKDITNIAEQGTIKNDAKNIENNASGNIKNTAQNGTITNDAKDIVNNATGDMTNTVGGKLTTTVTGQATENFNGGLDTNVTGTENHTVTGDQNIHVTGKQTNKIDGDQENIIGGNQTTTVTGDISNKAENITNEANTKLTDKVGDNTRVLDNEGITDTVPGAEGKGSTFKQRIDAIMGNVKTDAGESEVTQKGDEITSVVGKGEATNSRVTQKKNLLETAVTDGTNYNISNDTANASAKELTDGTKVNKLQDNLDSSEKTITNGTYKTSKLQTALDITNTAKDGTITNDAKDIVNNASGDMTNTVGGKLTTTVTGQATENFNGGLDTNVTGTENHTVTGDQNIHITGKQTNKIDGDQENTIGGNQTTTVTGDISNKAKNITNEASNSITDKVGDHTRVLDSDGITDTVGGSTFKQRIDKIMMESKDVSIKAEETLTNEAKVITNKASEVINNEAVNINNTATGIITSKASEIKNQADKLISNKVGENTWENMENGKITTSIKDGSKQNLTQSDAAGTTQSTVDGNKSTVTIQNADGLTDAVRDGAGNENGSVATATTSANTIKSGSKANTVISTADGTSFINSEAAAPVTGESGVGTAKNTTIKGNTITSGKVTMDYAEVMKDLGVRGNANITGKTTTGSLEVTGTSTLKGDVTMGSNATVKKDLTVEGNTNLKNTKVDGTLDVTQKATFGDSVSIAKDLSVDGNATIKGDVTAKSYKVGDKTYISAAGINANDQKITNVADGSISEGSKDAVNGGQLYTVKNDLEGKVNKVGANAAAMANLHPMEFDPDSKWNIAAAIGNYGSETAAALGAFYRPNNDVMVNLSTAFGTGENMVGGGVSVRLGKGSNKLSREENNALKAQVDDLTARMDALLSVLNPNMSKDFPDVPENHWAYEAVSRLAGNDIVQGYPDGEFHGERTMTRYEMAEIIYNALSRGAEAEKELVEEFKPELQAMAASEKDTAEKSEG